MGGGNDRHRARLVIGAALAMVLASTACSSSGSPAVSSSLDGGASAPSLTGPSAWEGVAVELRLSGDGFGTAAEQQRVYELEDVLAAAIRAKGVGEYDGNAFGDGSVTLYAYGPDAEALWTAMKAPIAEFGPSNGSSATLRFGSVDDPGATERVIALP